MKPDIDFKFRDDLFDSKKEGSTCPIELMLDPFTGVVYHYTTVAFKVGEDDIPRISFEYEIDKTNDLSMTTLRKNQKFNATLGLILNALLLDASEAESVSETGTNNSKEPDQERGLHEEGSTVS